MTSVFARPIVIVTSVAFLATISLKPVAMAAEGLQFGFTFTHVVAHCPPLPVKAASVKLIAGTDASDNIILHYDDSRVRKSALQALAKMHAGGATTVRSVVWFRHGEEADMARYKDQLGLLVASKGKLPEIAIANLSAYALAVRDQGYRRYYVVVGPLGQANPKCKRTQWGDCFDPTSLARSWRVLEQIAQALHRPTMNGLDIVLDIAPEDCADPRLANPLRGAQAEYTRYMITRYRDEFHDRAFFVSCGGQPVARAFGGLDWLTALYKELNVQPAAIDVHIYDANPTNVQAVSLKAESDAAKLGVPLDILETYYNGDATHNVIGSLNASGELRRLRTVMVWPVHKQSECQIDIAAPFSLGPFIRAVGR